MAAAKMARGIVARGRTINAPHPTQRRIVGRHENGEAIEGPVMVAYGPGSELELAADEIARLRKSGFLIDPAQPVIDAGAGNQNYGAPAEGAVTRVGADQ